MTPKSTANEPRVALFAGSFDPFTRGHADIVSRGLGLFDNIIIGIGINTAKTAAAAAEARLAPIEALYAGEPRVSVEVFSTLTVDFALSRGAHWLL